MSTLEYGARGGDNSRAIRPTRVCLFHESVQGLLRALYHPPTHKDNIVKCFYSILSA